MAIIFIRSPTVICVVKSFLEDRILKLSELIDINNKFETFNNKILNEK